MAESDPISMAEYSRRRGCSRAAVTLAVKHGRIKSGAVEVDGKVMILAEVADREWSSNTDPSRYRPTVEKQSRQAMPNDRPMQPAGRMPASVFPEAGDIDYTRARAEREWAESQLKMLELKKACAEIAPVEPIVRAIAAINAEAASKLGDLPDLLAPRLAAESDQSVIWSILNKEIEALRAAMQRKCMQLAQKIEVGA